MTPQEMARQDRAQHAATAELRASMLAATVAARKAEYDARYGTADAGYPHDYGQLCCCEACTGPDGEDCRPDLFGSRCVRCNRAAVLDDRETTAGILEAIAERVASQAAGQLSWIDAR